MSTHNWASPDKIRWAAAEERYVANARRPGCLPRKCRASLERLLRLFRSEKLLCEIAEELNVSKFNALKLYEYVKEFCNNETSTDRTKRLVKLRLEKRKQAVAAMPLPQRLTGVAEIARAARCEVRPAIREKPMVMIRADLLIINGHLCYVHHLPHTDQLRIRVWPDAHPVTHRIFCLSSEGEIKCIYAVPNEVLREYAPNGVGAFFFHCRSRLAVIRGAEIDFSPYLVTERLNRWPRPVHA